MRADPKGFGRIMWDNWSPPGWYDNATFEAVAVSWESPDFVDVTLHSYQARWDEAEPDPRSAELEAKVKATETLSTPTLYIQGAEDGVNPPEASNDVPPKFSGPFTFVTLDGVGHFSPREAPDAVAAALIRRFRCTTGEVEKL
ncbi:alpha/beta hydrolase [Methylobacterium sp. Leaf102]|uniref:alpha/beta fold hydrolase n=1 Tax=Methylobacterium sp. Leaf102 TaxID=1736253 RepID=UPI000AC89B50|nr:alpha/beta hydrolase [Methylobacterium sp. Leaf102]